MFYYLDDLVKRCPEDRLDDVVGNVRFGRCPVISGVSRDVTSWFAYAEEWARQVC